MTEKEQKQSLFALTVNFIEMLKKAGSGGVELAAAEQRLGVNKRRVYDIANVLAGIGLVERTGKSVVRWTGRADGGEAEAELDAAIGTLDAELSALVASEDFAQHAWIDRSDLRCIDTAQFNSVMGIRGPREMSMNVSSTGGEFSLYCSAESGQIELVPMNWE